MNDDPTLLAHRAAQAQFQKVDESFKHLQNLRLELDHLNSLGDMLSPEDVVKSASNLVGKGFSAHEMAVLLSEMPDNPEALRGWVAQQDQMVQEWEANAHGILGQARHQLGVTALHVLMKDHMTPSTSSTAVPGASGMGMSQGSSSQAAAPSGPSGGMALTAGSPTQGSA